MNITLDEIMSFDYNSMTWGIDLSKEEVEEKEEKIVSWKNKLKK